MQIEASVLLSDFVEEKGMPYWPPTVLHPGTSIPKFIIDVQYQGFYKLWFSTVAFQ